LTFAVLKRLADGDFHSGETLARDLDVSRASVWNALNEAAEHDIAELGIRQHLTLLGGTTTRAADGKTFDRAAFVLDTKTDPTETGYVKVRSFVDQATCTLLRAELFAVPEAPRKVLEAAIASLVEVEPYWLMLGYQLTDRAEGTVTRVKLSDVYLLERLDDALFEPASFYRVEP